MKERVAILFGKRSPFVKAGSLFSSISADDLGARVLRTVLLQSSTNAADIDEVIIGNVAQPSNAANISRVIALKAGIPDHVPAYSVQRNCASGMESVSSGINKLLADQAATIVAGGAESMTNIPFLFKPEMKRFFERLMRARKPLDKAKVFMSFKFSHLMPVIGLVDGLTDPVCGQIMGTTAENLAKEFKILRSEQDEYALASHQKACDAMNRGVFREECVSIDVSPRYDQICEDDIGPREDQTIEALQKLRPYFDRHNGTVTVGNACSITDGSAMLILKRESEVKRLGLEPLGYISGYDYAGLEPHRMGLGPVYATAKLFKKMGMTLKDIDLIEMNEAFAAQIIANVRAFESDSFAKEYLGQDKAVGEINPDIFNVNGGAIALGHPVGVTGTRLILTLLMELRRRKLNRGLATLCVGGGQGGSFIVEVN
ncbi:acetyl-CoA C-acyltransferase [Candidatus Marinamargulisbacteria bacterium SCGC AG-343-D04]|nr:acetyl-CoA C-acyltransferase [Candidatus Marinamargulisbacteria bacterium SCGC AG-343-D04]